MDSSSIISILEYIFESKGQKNNIDSIDSFFEDGISFPSFISLIFNDDEIPNIVDNPETESDIESNNSNALNYLFKNNEVIRKARPNLDNSESRNKLLVLILKEQCFTQNPKKILKTCNSLVQPLNIKYDSEQDLIKKPNLITILHVLTNGKVENVTEEDKNIDDLLTKSFEKANVPLILNSEPLNDQNRFKFYIQVEIIFDHLLEKSKSASLRRFLKKKKKSKFFSSVFNKKFDFSESSSDTAEYMSDDDDEKENESLQNEALLKTINAIGSKGGIFFDSFDSAVKNDAIPKFVMYFFNCESIENVNVASEKKKSKIYTGRLTNEEIQNIEAVIEFLKTKKEKFKILLFDFRDLKSIKASTILFYTNFLNCFFIKTMKQEMYQRIVRILCSHTSKFDERYNSILFTKYKVFASLLHFIAKGNLHFNFDYHKVKFTDEMAQPYFVEANVPMIVNRQLLLFAKKYVSFPVFYQLQFIFDELDKRRSSTFIAETIMNAIFVVKSIKVPKFSELPTSIKAKRKSLKYQKEMSSKYGKQDEPGNNDGYKKKEKKEIAKPKTFLDICNEKEGYLSEMKQLIQSNKSDVDTNVEMKSFDEFWNHPDPDYKYDKGIVYNTKSSQKNKKNSSEDWINEMSNIQKNIKKRIRKTLGGNNDAIQQSLMFNRRKSGFGHKLYKIFSYKEETNKWVFNSSNFKDFSKEKRIDVKDSKTPLILFFNSYEDDLTLINTNLINTFYPNLEDKNPDEIFVYALCDRSLTMLNFIVDFNNAEKASIKPIFLLLHVPKSKENLPNIRLIITQIYSFLTKACDLDVTVLNSQHYLDQIEFIKDIIKINKCFNLATDKSKNKSPFSFVYQPPSSRFNKKIKTTSRKLRRYRNKIKRCLVGDDDDSDNDDGNDGDDDDIYVPSSLIAKQSKFVILVNDATVQSDNEIDSKINNSELFKNLISQIKSEVYMYYINVKESETYESFLNCMNDIIMKGCSLFDEVQANFKYIKAFNFTDRYIQMIIKDDYINDLESFIYQRLKMLQIKDQSKDQKSEKEEKKAEEEEKKAEKEEKNSEEDQSDDGDDDDDDQSAEEEDMCELNFRKEIRKAIPSDNKEFIQQCLFIKNTFYHNNCCNETIRKLLKENLQVCSNSHLSFIDQSVGQKYFWQYKQMADMVSAHKKFLKDQYASMIQNLISEDLFMDAFEYNFDIVERQLERDGSQIMQMMQPFIDKLKVKSSISVHDLRNTMQEGTNYAMKETENLREIKVAVQVNKDLKSEIPQDF